MFERNVQHTKIYSGKEFAAFYDFGQILGQGVFGTVLEVKEKRTRKIWAAKVIDKHQAVIFSNFFLFSLGQPGHVGKRW